MKEEELPLEDQRRLKREIIKLAKFFLPVYLGFIMITIYFFVGGPETLNTGRSGGPLDPRIEITEDVEHNFWAVAPYVCSFILLMATIYFGRYYLQNVRPIFLDIRNRKKQLVFFKPEKSDMSAFHRYYLTIPITKNQLIEVLPEEFYMIDDKEFLHLEIGPNSQYILRLMYGDKEIKFFRKKAE